MKFEYLWQQYDFTESELLSMGRQLPGDYVLHLNYWDTSREVADRDRPGALVLQECTRLSVQLNVKKPGSIPSNLGTIIGWGFVTPAPWLESLQLSETEWIHLFFQVGGEGKIEALCRSLAIEIQGKACASTHNPDTLGGGERAIAPTKPKN